MKQLQLTVSFILSIVIFIVFFGGQIRAQQAPPWQAADNIREALFQAQRDIFAAARADNPATLTASAVASVETAGELYQSTLHSQFLQTAPDSDSAIMAALAQAQVAAAASDGLALAATRGRVWTALLQGSYQSTVAALEAGDAAAVAPWLQLREYREATRVTTVDDEATRAVAALQAGDIASEEALSIVTNELRDTYFFQLRESLNELEAAIEQGFAVRTAEWAGQASGYFAILRPDFALKQGEAAANQLATQLSQLEAAAIDDDQAAALTALTDLKAGLANYQPVEFNPGEVDKRAQLLYLFTDLIYIEYKDGVRNGEISIPIEYQEAITFRDQAETVFEELRPVIATSDPQAAERLAQLLTEIETIMVNLGEKEAVEARVTEALGLIETSLAVEAQFNDTESALVIINTLLDDVVAATQAGRYDEAERARLETYAIFENGLEQRLGNRALQMSRELEGRFWEGTQGQKGLATLLREEAPPAEIEAAVNQLREQLVEAQAFLDAGLTGFLAALNSAIIIIREGLEAVLIIGAILGYMRATQAPRKYSMWVYLGVFGAIALSVLTWWAAEALITISVANRELIEGVTSLIAAAVLFYVTNWLFHKVYVIDWMTFVKEQVGKALSTGSAVGLAALGFTVVYREGLETVLFYQALLFDAEAVSVLVGFLIGSVIIFAIAFAILRLSKRLPLKPFFIVTALLLLLLAFNFVGSGVRELQEAGLVDATLIGWVPESLVLMEGFGIFPTAQTTAAQIVFIVAILFTLVYSYWQGRQPKAQAVSSH